MRKVNGLEYLPLKMNRGIAVNAANDDFKVVTKTNRHGARTEDWSWRKKLVRYVILAYNNHDRIMDTLRQLVDFDEKRINLSIDYDRHAHRNAVHVARGLIIDMDDADDDISKSH